MKTALMLITAVAIDELLGEPRRYHPLIGFGRIATWIERRLYGAPVTDKASHRARGIAAVLLCIAPFAAMAAWIAPAPGFGIAFEIGALYFALGHRSLHDHARPVADALLRGDDAQARSLVSRMVSRDSAALDIAPAATESVLENGNDGVFGALFWFLVAGGAGAIAYRLANTLDAMWGYRNARYLHFGWAAARLDDVLNWIPARLTALTYALLGRTRTALACWFRQAGEWDSPNAGPVMAAGAGALGVRIGGPARYEGKWHARPVLGVGDPPQREDIGRALALVRNGVVLWIVLTLVITSATAFALEELHALR